MNKIFKYKVDDSGCSVIPKNSHVIRAAHVDDGFYKGDFLWAIIDTEDLNETISFNLKDSIDPITKMSWYESLNIDFIPKGARYQIAVKEKQVIPLRGIPYGAHEEDGKIYVYYFEDIRMSIEYYRIAVYKTGQEIDIPLEKLQYLGLNRIWIIQELGLYTFLVK